jgi:ribosome-binding protein aMBF1 (putative translation factor)
MLEVTRVPITGDDVELTVRIPRKEAESIAVDMIAKEVRKALDAALSYTPEEVFGPRVPGRLIRGGRTREGWTQSELAKRLGVSKTVVSDLEHGRRPISKKMAGKLGEVFGSSPLVFLA